MGRRSFLVAVAAVVGALAGIELTGRSLPPIRKPNPAGEVPASDAASKSVLVAYFSRPGENYYYGGRTNLDVGNTEVLAGMISRRLGCDVYRLEAVDPYSDDYEETVERNVHLAGRSPCRRGRRARSGAQSEDRSSQDRYPVGMSA